MLKYNYIGVDTVFMCESHSAIDKITFPSFRINKRGYSLTDWSNVDVASNNIIGMLITVVLASRALLKFDKSFSIPLQITFSTN